ncbi:MAG: alkaline phosphatase [candidate division WOR-3 bacterium]|nr:alkaline phosphatase [candidate division WOR-3 bacterium]
MTIKKIFLMVITFYLLFAQEYAGLPILPSDLEVRNIIFFIGDGMGISQIQAARIKSKGALGRLNMELMPVVGLVNTCAADKLITDSGAGGTALASGIKTNIGAIGVDPSGMPYCTILEACQKIGKSTGLVVTSSITHATPATFAAHVPTRMAESEIAEQLIYRKVNVLLGGGRAFFLPKKIKGSKRSDNRDLIKTAKELGYTVVEDKSALMNAKADYLLGLFQMEHMKNDPVEPTLAEMTKKAIEILTKDPDGFFLMVEGSQIDWECHANQVGGMIEQVLMFDEAVKAGLEFALKDSHTIVIVTADHETGGLGITGGMLDGSDLNCGWLSKDHTAVMVPIFAFGPKAIMFTGVKENIEIPRILAKIAGLDSLPVKCR